MPRNCITAIVVWLALVCGYLWILFPRIGMPGILVAAPAMATIVWTGLAVMYSGRQALSDWRARNRMARGERPADGAIVAASGEIRPMFDVLHSPLRGVPCVAYSYKIGPPSQTSAGPRPDYFGFAMTRCQVQTPYGSFHLGSFPIFEGSPDEIGDRDVATKFVAATYFEVLEDIPTMAKTMLGLHQQAPPFRKDWQLGAEPSIAIADALLEERVIGVGARVTAIGCYVAATNSIVSDADGTGLLRLTPGGEPRRESPFPTEAVTKVLGGAVTVIVANVVLWWGLGRMVG